MKYFVWMQLVLLVFVVTSCTSPTSTSVKDETKVLKLDQAITVNQDLNINIVFIGFEPGEGPRDINEAMVKEGLPSTHNPINRFPSFYTGNVEYVGTSFDFAYNFVYANQAFEDRFFAFLTSELNKTRPIPEGETVAPTTPTAFQSFYNCQFIPDDENPPCEVPAENISLPVTENYWIDAMSTEKYLAQNLTDLNVNTSDYTLVFINWFGREDFKFHTYSKTDEVETDTGFPFGLFSSAQMVAWGGSPEAKLGQLSRLWFMDFSAGPEGPASSWDVTAPFGYTIPPIWEYGSEKETYRPFNTLSKDVAKVARFVGINLLFTPSMIYRSALTPPTMPDDVQLDVTLYQAAEGFDGKALFNAERMNESLSFVQPLTTFSTDIKDEPIPPAAVEAFTCYAFGVPCDPSSIISSYGGDLFLHAQSRLGEVLEGDAAYEIPIFAYSLPAEVPLPLLGVAEDDFKGTQSVIQSMTQPFFPGDPNPYVYGLTDTTIHEVGHHIGLSHPHDGYDFEYRLDYGAVGPFNFVWLGDASHSIMSYLSITSDFGQFNLDTMNRALTLDYLNQAAAVMMQLEGAGKLESAKTAIIAADGKAQAALNAYNSMDYSASTSSAKEAHAAVLKAASDAGVTVSPYKWQEVFKTFSVPGQRNSGITIMHGNMPINDGKESLERRLSYLNHP